MEFFERLSNGWELTKRSLTVLKEDKEILMFPILSAVTSIILIGLMVIIWLLLIPTNSQTAQMSIIIFSLIFLVLTYSIVTFFKSAIITSATIRLNGKNPSLADGLKTPFSKLGKIISWALVLVAANIVLSIIRGQRQKGENPLLGASRETAANVAETAWNLLTYFVLPVILFEELGLWDSTKRSTALFKETWGENIAAQFTTGIIFFLGYVILAIPCGLLVLTSSTAMLILAIVIASLGIISLSVLQTSVNGILIASLYYYAVKGKVPKIFSGSNPKEFFKKK